MVQSLLLIGALVLGQADADAAKEELRVQTRQLVLKLNAQELSERDAAEKKLVELGPDILPYLPRTSSRTPAEVRQRLGRVVQAVESMAAKQAVESSTITLDGEMSIKDVLDAFEKQSRNRIIGYEDMSNDIKIAFEKTPYWQALDNVLDQAGLSVQPFSQESGVLTVMAKPDGQTDRVGRAAYARLFRFEPIRIRSVRDLLNPTVQGTTVTLNVAWEPRLTPISLSQPFDQIKATDENGEEITIVAEGRQDVAVSPGMSSVEVELPFPLPARNIQKIAKLEGEMLAMLPGRVERFEFTRLKNASNEDQRRAGVTVTLERVRKAQALYRFWIRVRFDEASNALESYRGWITGNKAYLISPEGEQLEPASLETTFQSDNEIGVAYNFDREEGIDRCRFRYETPALLIQMPVKYVLKDIELP